MPTIANNEPLSAVRPKINEAINRTEGVNALVIAVGAETLPGVAFTGDLDTGLYHPTDDTIGACTGGSERLRVHPTGGVSVGTTTDPGATNMRVAGTMRHGPLTLTGGTQNWTVTPSGTTLTFAYNGVNVMRLSSSGDLEITGTLTESALLP